MFEFMSHLAKDPSTTKKLGLYENGFFPVSKVSTDIAERELGFELPSELLTFYAEIGEGRLQTGTNGKHTDNNLVASPSELAKLLNGTSDWLMPYSQIEPDVLPFFQRDVDLFLCLHPKSDNPNAVYWMWGENMPNGGKICDSLVEFFQRLVVDPDWFNPPKE
jgi:hypothetical protein